MLPLVLTPVNTRVPPHRSSPTQGANLAPSVLPIRMFILFRFRLLGQGKQVISWAGETVENFMPPLSVSETEITKVLSQYSSVTTCVSTIIFLILGMV